MHSVEIIIWVITLLLMLVGLIGSFTPMLPGSFLIFTGALLHKCFLPQYTSWFTIVLLTACVGFSAFIDWICVAYGAKRAGASKWGISGATFGLMIGIFFSLPGMILGPIIGAILGELIMAQKSLAHASFTGAMTLAALIIAAALRFTLSIIMIIIFFADYFLF